ncbi:MAG: hypothetical protein ABSC23_13655 [Bryobacteraceae bacterium]|jgi:hypothetical protein
MKKSSRKKKTPKRVLRLPDLDYAKTAVLNTLGSPASKRAYEFAIDDFVIWYCSESRLAFSKAVVVRYRLDLESRGLDNIGWSRFRSSRQVELRLHRPLWVQLLPEPQEDVGYPGGDCQQAAHARVACGA